MKRALVVVAATLVMAGATAGAVIIAASEQEPAFTEADAEGMVRDALERCDRDLRDARPIECDDVGEGFACRADGRFIAGFDEPDPEHPEFSLVC